MMKALPTLFLSVIFFSACEKETYVDYHIDNQSSSVITINGSDLVHSSSIDQTINPKEKKDVASWSKRGKQTEHFEPTAMFGNDMVITNASGDTLTKDYKLLANWTTDVDDQRAVANHEYILVITDADF